MYTNVIPVAFTVFFILAVIGSGMISSAFYVINKETQRGEEGNPIPVLNSGIFRISVIVGISGLVIITFSLFAVGILKDLQTNKIHDSIITSAENDYNVTIHPRPGQEDNYALPAMDGTPVPVIVEYQGKLYDNAYILTYSSAGNGTVELELNHTVTLDDSVPTPEEMKQ